MIARNAELSLRLAIPGLEIGIIDWPVHAAPVQSAKPKVGWDHSRREPKPMPRRTANHALVSALERWTRRLDHIGRVALHRRSARVGLRSIGPTGAATGGQDVILDQAVAAG